MTQVRKRGRNLQEDEVEFMPLSKRINNLHIDNPMLLENSSINNVEWGPGLTNCISNMSESPPATEQTLDWNMQQCQPEYLPDLNANQNPHYFNINKLLFEMYIQRVQRGGCHQI